MAYLRSVAQKGCLVQRALSTSAVRHGGATVPYTRDEAHPTIGKQHDLLNSCGHLMYVFLHTVEPRLSKSCERHYISSLINAYSLLLLPFLAFLINLSPSDLPPHG